MFVAYWKVIKLVENVKHNQNHHLMESFLLNVNQFLLQKLLQVYK